MNLVVCGVSLPVLDLHARCHQLGVNNYIVDIFTRLGRGLKNGRRGRCMRPGVVGERPADRVADDDLIFRIRLRIWHRLRVRGFFGGEDWKLRLLLNSHSSLFSLTIFRLVIAPLTKVLERTLTFLTYLGLSIRYVHLHLFLSALREAHVSPKTNNDVVQNVNISTSEGSL